MTKFESLQRYIYKSLTKMNEEEEDMFDEDFMYEISITETAEDLYELFRDNEIEDIYLYCLQEWAGKK